MRLQPFTRAAVLCCSQVLFLAAAVTGQDPFKSHIRPTEPLSPEQQREFMAADVSGDWRRENGNLELMAVASVNVPGFPIVPFVTPVPNNTMSVNHVSRVAAAFVFAKVLNSAGTPGEPIQDANPAPANENPPNELVNVVNRPT